MVMSFDLVIFAFLIDLLGFCPGHLAVVNAYRLNLPSEELQVLPL
jgi:hypothetical protein